MRQFRPALCGLGRKVALQHRIEQAQPDVKHRRPHISGGLMGGKGIAVIATLHQDRIAPKARDLRLMFGPIGDMHGKNRAKAGVLADGGVKFRHDQINLGGGDGKAWGQGIGHNAASLALAACACKRPQCRTPSRIPHPFDLGPGPAYKAGMSCIFMPVLRIIGPAS